MKVIVVGEGNNLNKMIFDEYDRIGFVLSEGDKTKLRESGVTPDMLQNLIKSLNPVKDLLAEYAEKVEQIANELAHLDELNKKKNNKPWKKKRFYE